ncbi:uncharacterized protein [Drosophila pseudoobscura]|uniref:Uncharacterized protein n=1 Tax=Drosophila pseudoobscura pseudoobscura TaxID=46245 RepID=A0A6I8UZX1_DROPS|nr:uncharacterized protein LOC6901069 [Drosophila pseudoobscura]
MTNPQMNLSAAIVGCLCLCLCLGQLQAAAILCGSEAKSLEDLDSYSDSDSGTTPKPPSEVTKFVHSVQCTLEKAKPWIENIEKEAKLLEEKARDVTRSLLQRITLFVNVLTLPKPPKDNTQMDKDQDTEKEGSSTIRSTTEGVTSPSTGQNEEATTTPAPPTPTNIEWLGDDANEVDSEVLHGMKQ